MAVKLPDNCSARHCKISGHILVLLDTLFVASSDPFLQLLNAVSSELTRAVLIAQEKQQTCLEHTVQALSLCLETENFKKLQLLVRSLFPKGTDPPEVGNALWQQPLDWQCQWVQLRSLQCIAAVAKFKTLKVMWNCTMLHKYGMKQEHKSDD